MHSFELGWPVQASLHMPSGEPMQVGGLAQARLGAMHPRMHDTATRMHASSGFRARQLQDASNAVAPAAGALDDDEPAAAEYTVVCFPMSFHLNDMAVCCVLLSPQVLRCRVLAETLCVVADCKNGNRRVGMIVHVTVSQPWRGPWPFTYCGNFCSVDVHSALSTVTSALVRTWHLAGQ